MTPRASCSAVSEAILLYAPRSLNENTCSKHNWPQAQHTARHCVSFSMKQPGLSGSMAPLADTHRAS